MTLLIEPISAFNDNYIWALSEQQKLCVVDPGDADPVIRYAQDRRLQLDCILITHHHNDHIGGVEKLRERWPEVTIIGPQKCISSKDVLAIADDDISWHEWRFKVLAIPGHTLEHIAYYCDDNTLAQSLLFCGDTLFTGGCGRIFEGTPEQMFNSLQLLAQLPASTLVYCAHEYTLSNLRFALAVEPDNADLQQRIKQDTARRHNQIPTVPSSLQIERATNPFLRCHIPAVQQAAKTQGNQNTVSDTTARTQSVHTFATLREWKNNF